MIRSLQSQDHDFFIQMCVDFYHSEAVIHAVPVSCFETTFDKIMEQSPWMTGYLIESDGKPAGYALLAFSYSNEVGGMVVWIEELYILPQFQGKGLGKEFFAFVGETFTDAKRFRLEVTHSNKRAVHLYESLGFTDLDYLQMIKEQ